MKSNVRAIRLLALGSVAALALACAGTGEPDADSSTNEKSAAESFEYAPTETTDAKPSIEELVAGNSLVGKGSVTRKRSSTFNYTYAIPPGRTLTLYTTNATSAVDPVCVIYTRTDAWINTTAWVDTPSRTYQAPLTTLAINDDVAPGNRNASVSYKNQRGDSFTVRVLCFAYDNYTGNLPVWRQLDGESAVNLGTKYIVSGSYIKNDGATTLTTTGGGNPVLLAFPNTVGDGYGAWNDDSPNGGTESKLTGLAANVTYWIVPMVYPSTPDRTAGDTTINF